MLTTLAFLLSASAIAAPHISDLTLVSEKGISAAEMNSSLGTATSGGTFPNGITGGNYPMVYTNGSNPNTVTSGNIPNAFTNGNYPDRYTIGQGFRGQSGNAPQPALGL
jgi:hypothetical protein